MTRLLLVVAAVALMAVLAAAGVGVGAEWEVYPGESIQDAINASYQGDTIYVHAGTYVENVAVGKERLTLIGDSADMVTVRAADAEDHVFEVTASWVNINGFSVTGAMDGDATAGIYLNGTNYCSISDNTASNNRYGIYLRDSNSNTITSNAANSNDWKGICLWHSSNNTLTNSTISNNGKGIILDCSSNNTLANNTVDSNDWCGILLDESSSNMFANNAISGNRYNFGIWGTSLSEYIQNIDTSNTVDGKSVYYWVDQRDTQVPDDAGFVGVVNSTNITAKDLTLINNLYGILFAYTRDSRIENVNTSNNEDGICIRYSNNNTIVSNNASNNRGGIDLCSSSNNTLANNTANSNNAYGIILSASSIGSSSSNNTLASNNASNNRYGIFLWYSGSNTLADNMMSGNSYNFGIVGSPYLSHYIQDIDTSNTVDGKSIYYWVDQQDKVIPPDAGFVGVVNSTNITVKDITLTNNWYGVLFAYTENSRIVHVNASNTHDYGVLLHCSNNNMLANNTANSNNLYGIHLHSSSNNILVDNTANSDNRGGGICLTDLSNSNTLYHNNLAGNTNHNAYDTGTNQWDSSSEGNYYSDYTGADNNTDGIGDDPHPIPGGESIDRFPLMHPWTGDTSLKGDLNHDDQITPADAAIALRLAATGAQNPAADVSGDDRVTSLDALMILQAAAKRIEL
jgi:parallel beta-helix repeat protein